MNYDLPKSITQMFIGTYMYVSLNGVHYLET